MSVSMASKILLCCLVLLLFTSHSSLAEILSVKGENVNLRTQPTTNSAVKWEYGTGFPLKALERKGEWVKVIDFEKDSGWIHSSLLTKTPYVIVNINKDSTKYINIRSEPSTSSNIVGKAYYGVVFERLEEKSGWVKVKHETGLIGWIKATLLWGL